MEALRNLEGSWMFRGFLVNLSGFQTGTDVFSSSLRLAMMGSRLANWWRGSSRQVIMLEIKPAPLVTSSNHYKQEPVALSDVLLEDPIYKTKPPKQSHHGKTTKNTRTIWKTPLAETRHWRVCFAPALRVCQRNWFGILGPRALQPQSTSEKHWKTVKYRSQLTFAVVLDP